MITNLFFIQKLIIKNAANGVRFLNNFIRSSDQIVEQFYLTFIKI